MGRVKQKGPLSPELLNDVSIIFFGMILTFKEKEFPFPKILPLSLTLEVKIK